MRWYFVKLGLNLEATTQPPRVVTQRKKSNNKENKKRQFLNCWQTVMLWLLCKAHGVYLGLQKINHS